MKNFLAFIAIACLLWVGLGGALPHVPIPGVHYEPPISGGGLSVLIIYESDPVSPHVSTILNSEDWQKVVSDHGGDYRIFDQNQEIADPKWKAALARPRQSIPWLIVSGPKSGFEGPLPDSDAGLVNVIQEHAG